MRQLLVAALVFGSLVGAGAGVCQTNTQQTKETKSELKQKQKADKAQDKADKQSDRVAPQ